MIYYIYVLQNKINNKIYVGQTSDIRRRKSSYSGNNSKKSVINSAIKKYGRDNFTFQVIEEWETPNEIDDAEIFWIHFFQSRKQEFGYNLAIGGRVNRGMIRSPEYIQKSKASKKEYFKTHSAWNLGIPASEEVKIKLSSYKGEKTSKALFTNEQAKILRLDFWNGNYTISDFAKIYNITAKGMAQIIYNKYYYDEKFIITEVMKLRQKEIVRKKQSENTKKQFSKK